MFRISKSFTFDAAHHLKGLQEGHKCGRPHGHTYEVIVVLEDVELDQHGFVRDYGELDPIKRTIDKELDHRDLNTVLTFQPTAENMAKYIYHRFKPLYPQLAEVTVKETPRTAATYRWQ